MVIFRPTTHQWLMLLSACSTLIKGKISSGRFCVVRPTEAVNHISRTDSDGSLSRHWKIVERLAVDRVNAHRHIFALRP